MFNHVMYALAQGMYILFLMKRTVNLYLNIFLNLIKVLKVITGK